MRAADPLTAARTMLRAATGSLDGGAGWTMSYRSVYIAQAIYQYGGYAGHVIGDRGGLWWWAVQSRPGLVGPRSEAPDVLAACVAAKKATRSAYSTAKYRRAHTMDGKTLYETTAMLAGQLSGIPLTVFADLVDRLTREVPEYAGTAHAVLPALPEMYRETFVAYVRVLRRADQSGAGARQWLRDAGRVAR